MPIEYAPNDEMSNALVDLISNPEFSEFTPIRDQDLLFLVASAVKTDKDGGALPTSGDPVIVRRVGPADAVFLQGHFKVYICNLRWDEANALQRQAMLHRALMRVDVEVDGEGAEKSIKIRMRKPDVSTFQQTIVRFGAWEGELITLRNNLQAARQKTKELEAELAGNSK